jgi:ribosomal protein S18 acetylase RimI-like enzyme
MGCNSFDLDELPDSAIELINLENRSFFCSLAWYRNFQDMVLANDQDWKSHFIVYENDKSVQLVLPLKSSVSISGYRTFESLTNFYSPLFQIFTKLDRSGLAGFFKAFSISGKNWDTLVLRAMPEYEVRALRSDLKQAGLPCIPFFCFANWYLEVNQLSFDEYFLELSSRVRNTVTRKTKQFNRLEGTKVEIVTEGEALAKGIKAFETVYAQSWKDEETYPEFISGLIKMASKQGALRLAVAYINDVAVAAQLWIVADNTAYIYKLAYDEKYKKLSIGSILTATLMRHVIDVDKVDFVDYLSGDDAYKKEWMSHRRERWGIMIFNWRSWKGCLKMINEFTRFYLKKFLNK